MMPGQPPSDPMAYAPVAPQQQRPDRDQMLMEYLMQQGAAQPEQQKIAQQRATANLLRQGGMQAPGMRSSRASTGGTMDTAPHPLEMLGQLAQAGAGAYTGMQADAASQAAQALQGQQLADLRKRMYGAAQTQGEAQLPMGGGM